MISRISRPACRMRPCGPSDQIHADDEDTASSAFQHALSKFEEIVHAWSAEGCALAALPSQLRRLKCDASTAAIKGVEAQDEPQCAVAASQADIWSAARLFTHRGTFLFYTALPDETCRNITLAMNGRNNSHLCSCNQPRQTILSLGKSFLCSSQKTPRLRRTSQMEEEYVVMDRSSSWRN